MEKLARSATQQKAIQRHEEEEIIHCLASLDAEVTMSTNSFIEEIAISINSIPPQDSPGKDRHSHAAESLRGALCPSTGEGDAGDGKDDGGPQEGHITPEGSIKRSDSWGFSAEFVQTLSVPDSAAFAATVAQTTLQRSESQGEAASDTSTASFLVSGGLGAVSVTELAMVLVQQQLSGLDSIRASAVDPAVGAEEPATVSATMLPLSALKPGEGTISHKYPNSIKRDIFLRARSWNARLTAIAQKIERSVAAVTAALAQQAQQSGQPSTATPASGSGGAVIPGSTNLERMSTSGSFESFVDLYNGDGFQFRPVTTILDRAHSEAIATALVSAANSGHDDTKSDISPGAATAGVGAGPGAATAGAVSEAGCETGHAADSASTATPVHKRVDGDGDNVNEDDEPRQSLDWARAASISSVYSSVAHPSSAVTAGPSNPTRTLSTDPYMSMSVRAGGNDGEKRVNFLQQLFRGKEADDGRMRTMLVDLGGVGIGRLGLRPGRKGEVIAVHEDEMASIIAYSLASEAYHGDLQKLFKEGPEADLEIYSEVRKPTGDDISVNIYTLRASSAYAHTTLSQLLVYTMHTYIRTVMHTHMHTRRHIRTHTHAHICIYTHAHTCIHTFTHAYTHFH